MVLHLRHVCGLIFVAHFLCLCRSHHHTLWLFLEEIGGPGKQVFSRNYHFSHSFKCTVIPLKKHAKVVCRFVCILTGDKLQSDVALLTCWSVQSINVGRKAPVSFLTPFSEWKHTLFNLHCRVSVVICPGENQFLLRVWKHPLLLQTDEPESFVISCRPGNEYAAVTFLKEPPWSRRANTSGYRFIWHLLSRRLAL